MDKLDRILNKLDKVQEDVTDIKIAQATQSKDIAQNTVDLTEHKEGVMGNRTRIEYLEKVNAPLTVAQLGKRVVLWAGGLGTILGVIWLISKIYKL